MANSEIVSGNRSGSAAHYQGSRPEQSTRGRGSYHRFSQGCEPGAGASSKLKERAASAGVASESVIHVKCDCF